MTAVSIPQQQRACVRQGLGKDATAPVQQIPVTMPGPDQILVKINWSGLCASDKSLLCDEWADFGLTMHPDTKGIAGHEGAGVVVAVGNSMRHKWKLGDRAGIKGVYSICGVCEFCTNGTDELHCPAQKNSGFTVAGTFQEYCVADGNYTSRIPDGVSDEEAAPILCGGVTAYTACKRSNVKPGQWIVLQGAGGGLGHFAVQYAKAMGMRVIAIDTGEAKRQLCTSLGAEHFIDYQATEDIPTLVNKITTHGAHGVLITAATPAAFAVGPSLLRPKGTLVTVGIPTSTDVIAGAPPFQMVLKCITVVGSVVGTLKDVQEALDFAARGLVKPVLTRGSMEDLDEFLGKMKRGEIAGRAVIKVASS